MQREEGVGRHPEPLEDSERVSQPCSTRWVRLAEHGAGGASLPEANQIAPNSGKSGKT